MEPRIHEEWIRNVADRGIPTEKLERTRELINQAVPDCLITEFGGLIDTLELPDRRLGADCAYNVRLPNGVAAMNAIPIDALADRVREPGQPIISPQRMADTLHMELQELAAVAGVHRNTLRVSPAAGRLQECMREILRVMSAASVFGRSLDETVYWLHNHPIAALGHQTAMQLIREGHAQAVIDYLASIESGYLG